MLLACYNNHRQHLKKIFLLCCIVSCLCFQATAQITQGGKLRTGDLLFQDIDCGPLCDAIEAVTEGCRGKDFSHIGLVYRRNDSVLVIEAIGKDVHLTPLNVFAKRSPHPLVTGRVKRKYKRITQNAVVYALAQTGVPYDEVFLYDNGKYYCSELIFDAFKQANGGKPFFELQPMTFRQPGSKDFFPVWVDYYADLHTEIPEGKPGINPGGISRSKKIRIINGL